MIIGIITINIVTIIIMTRSTYPFHSHGCNHLWVGEALVNHFEFNHNDDTGDNASDDYENDMILIQLSTWLPYYDDIITC